VSKTDRSRPRFMSAMDLSVTIFLAERSVVRASDLYDNRPPDPAHALTRRSTFATLRAPALPSEPTAPHFHIFTPVKKSTAAPQPRQASPATSSAPQPRQAPP